MFDKYKGTTKNHKIGINKKMGKGEEDKKDFYVLIKRQGKL